MNLGYPTSSHPGRQPNLANGHFFAVVESRHHPFPLGKVADCCGKPLCHLSSQTTKQRIVFRAASNIGQLLFTGIFIAQLVQRTDLQVFQIAKQLLVGLEADFQLSGYFFLRRCMSEPHGKGSNCLFDVPAFAPHLPWSPIQGAKAIQDRSPNAEVRKSRKLRILSWLEFPRSLQ